VKRACEARRRAKRSKSGTPRSGKPTPRSVLRLSALGGFLLVCSLIADGAFGQSPFGRVWPIAEWRVSDWLEPKLTFILLRRMAPADPFVDIPSGPKS
jgi:hypothetical protein